MPSQCLGQSLLVSLLLLLGACDEQEKQEAVFTEEEQIGESDIPTLPTEPSEHGETNDSPATNNSNDGDSDGEDPEGPEVSHDCDIWAQDCDPGEKCVPASRKGVSDPRRLICVPVAGEQEAGEACEKNPENDHDNCDAQSICMVSQHENNTGFCADLCTGSADNPQCEDNYECLADVAVFVCLNKCDPTVQDCVEENSGCYLDGRNFLCLPTSPGGPLEDEACLYTSHCAPGGTCIPTMSYQDPACTDDYACCVAYCDINDEEPCQKEGKLCFPIYGTGQVRKIPGLEHVGVCVSLDG